MENKGVAVITGGASGIGEACAIKLSQDGYTVVIADVDSELGNRVAKKISGYFIYLDVTDHNQIIEVCNKIWTEIGPVTALINSAGIIQKGAQQPKDITIEDWDLITTVDYRGTYLTCVAFGEKMLIANNGCIVNIASITGMRSVPLHVYAPAKSAVISLTATLAAEWGPHNVRVNCISPGYTLTPAIKKAIESKERNIEDLTRNTALGRLVNPKEIANTASFLISKSASAITGVNLPVDAGWLCASAWGTYGGLRKY